MPPGSAFIPSLAPPTGCDRAREGAAKRLAGSRKGAETIREAFAQTLTRRHFAQLVGIHPTSLMRWEKAGIVTPTTTTVLGITTKVYTDKDVEFGHIVVRLLNAERGRLSLTDAAALAREALERQDSTQP